MKAWLRRIIEQDKKETEDWLKADTYFRANALMIFCVALGFWLGIIIGAGTIVSVLGGLLVLSIVTGMLAGIKHNRDKRFLPQTSAH